MRLSKRISLTIFLSTILFVLLTSVTTIQHQPFDGTDQYGWPKIFFKVFYKDGKMVSDDFDLINMLLNFLICLAINSAIMITIRLMKVNRTTK